MKTPVLETERLILRPISLDDASAVQKHFNNWEIIKHLELAVPWPYPDDGAETFLREQVLPHNESGEWMTWAITIKGEPDEAIGNINFSFSKNKDIGNRGFWMAQPYWGRGYMTEVVAAVNDFLFFEAGVESFTVSNAKTNEASRRIKEKTGAVYIGESMLEHHSGDTISEKWEMTRENWIKIRGRKI